jgi:hypothetical protein
MGVVLVAIPEPLHVLTEEELLSTIPNNTILHNNGVLTGDCILPPEVVSGYDRPYVGYWDGDAFLCCHTNVFALSTLGPTLAGHVTISAEFIGRDGLHNWLAEARLATMNLNEQAIKASKEDAQEREAAGKLRQLVALLRASLR